VLVYDGNMKLLLTHGTPRIKIHGLNCSISADSQCGIDVLKIYEDLLKEQHEVTILTNTPDVFRKDERLKTIEYDTLDELTHKFHYLVSHVEYGGIAHLAWLPPIFELHHRWRQGSETFVYADESSWQRDNVIIDMKLRDGVRDPIVKMLCKEQGDKKRNVLCRLGVKTEYTRNFRTLNMKEQLSSVEKHIGEKISMFVCDVYAVDGICEDMALVSRHGSSVFKQDRLKIAIIEALTFADK